MKKRLAYSPGRLVAILTFGVFGIINTEMGVVGIIPQIAETFGVTVPQAGWTVGVFALIVAVSAPVMPLLFSGTDRRTGSVVFAYDLNPRYGEQLPSVRLTGLAPDLRYRIREINLMPGQNPRIEHNDRVVSGDYLMKAGLKLFSTDRARSVVVELKAVSQLLAEHEAQLFNYLRVSKCLVGYLINFGSRDELEWKRYILADNQVASGQSRKREH